MDPTFELEKGGTAREVRPRPGRRDPQSHGAGPGGPGEAGRRAPQEPHGQAPRERRRARARAKIAEHAQLAAGGTFEAGDQRMRTESVVRAFFRLRCCIRAAAERRPPRRRRREWVLLAQAARQRSRARVLASRHAERRFIHINDRCDRAALTSPRWDLHTLCKAKAVAVNALQ